MRESALYVERLDQAQERLERLLGRIPGGRPPRSRHGRRAIDLRGALSSPRLREARPRQRAVHGASSPRGATRSAGSCRERAAAAQAAHRVRRHSSRGGSRLLDGSNRSETTRHSIQASARRFGTSVLEVQTPSRLSNGEVRFPARSSGCTRSFAVSPSRSMTVRPLPTPPPMR